MRKKAHLVAGLVQGLNVSLDPSLIKDTESPNLKEVRFDHGLVRKELGSSLFGSGLPLDGPIMLFDAFYTEGGSINTLVVTNKWVYKFDSITNTYTKKNPLQAFTGGSDDLFCSVTTLDKNGTDIFLLTNGKDDIMKWDGGGGNFVALGGLSGIQASLMIPFQNRLILANTIESGYRSPRRIRWSIVGDPETWSGTGSGFIELVDTVDWITGMVIGKGKLFIFKERSIWELIYVGGTKVFELAMRIDGIGTHAPESLVTLGEEILFFGTDNIYLYDGFDLEPLASQIYPYLYESGRKIVNSARLAKSPAVYIEELGEYWLVVPTSGDNPDTIFKYDFDSKSWAMGYQQINAFGFYYAATEKTWSQLVGSWNAQTWIWVPKALPSGAPTTLIGTYDGYVYEDDRLTKSTKEMLFETKDWIFGYAQRIVEVRIQARGGPFNVSYSMNQGDTWSSPKTFSLSSEFKEYILYLNETCKYFRVRVVSTAQDLDIKWIEINYVPRAQSKTLVTS